MSSSDEPEFTPEIWRQPIANIPLIKHHVELGHRYQTGDDILPSKMMAAAHFAAAAAHGQSSMKAQARLLAASLSTHQIRTAQALATLFVAQGRAQVQGLRLGGQNWGQIVA